MTYFTHFEESLKLSRAETVDTNNDGPGFVISPPVCPIPDAVIINLSDPDIATRYEYGSAQSALVTIVYPCICLFGILANSVFLLTVIRVPYMRTMINIYLSNLAVSDIMFLCTGSGFGLWKYLSTPVTVDYSILGGVVGCFFTQLLNSTPFYASTLLVTVVTMERYLAICRPILHRNINSRGRTVALVAATWLVAACLAAMLFPGSSNYNVMCVIWPDDGYYMNFPETIANCFSTELWAHGLASFVLTAPCFVAFAITFVMYFVIVRKLGRRIHKVPGEQSSTRARSRRTRDRVAKMLVITGTLFFIFLTPRVVVTFYNYIIYFTGAPSLSPNTQFIIFTSTNALLYVNSVTNPIIYAFSNERYRKAVWYAFCPGSKLTVVET